MSDLKYNLSGKVALITGSSSGIGAEIAVQFTTYGAKVVITGRNVDALDAVAARIREVTLGAFTPLQLVGDLLDETFPPTLIDATIQTYGRLDILVNNAGGATPNGALDSPMLMSEFDACLKLNVRSAVQLTKLAVPWLTQTRGNIINISSIASMKPVATWLTYCSTKAALDMVTKCSALELGPKFIRVNSINPGPVASPFGRSLGMNEEQFAEFQENTFISRSLMKRIGTVEDVANMASYLASNDARNVTGALMVNDSGFMLL